MREKPHNRENVFSNPAVQGRILIFFFALTAILIATNWIMSWRALSRLSQNVIALSSSDIFHRDVALLLKQQQAALGIQLIIYSLLSLILMALGAIVLSHRIGGPLHNLTAYCRGVVHGDKSPAEVHFRKRDIPQELASAFNEFQRHHGILSSPPEGYGPEV